VTSETPQSPQQSQQLSGELEILRRAEGELLRGLLVEIKKVVVGHDTAIENLLVCLLAQGHCLLEGLPGVAKTLMAQTVAHTVDAEFTRIQFTPDLVPSDIVGTRIYRSASERFDIETGPLFTNLVLADEINRAPAKVQSALLEVMAERQVTIGGHTLPVPRPFLVLATQNPIETEGVYPLPEAQRDRFLMKLLLDYPELGEEVEIARRMSAEAPRTLRMLDTDRLLTLQHTAAGVHVEPPVLEYAARLVMATRRPHEYGLGELARYLACGASPRATLGLIAGARAVALIHGRGFVLPDDVHHLACPVLRHRLILTYEALADEVTADAIVEAVLAAVPEPRRAMAHSVRPRRRS
jgi:MoxR-like ATPase